MTSYSNFHSIILLDPRGVVSTGGDDVIRRMDRYGRELLKIDSKFKFFIFSSHRIIESYKPKYVEMIEISPSTFNSLKFAIKASFFIKKNRINPKLFLSGDPWENFLSGYLVKIFLRKKIPIQLSIHADIASNKWRKLNFRNYLRFLVSYFALKLATQIRVVNKFQAEKIETIFGIQPAKFITVPVPILNLSKTTARRQQKLITLGFVGRVHKDRGLGIFIELITILQTVRQDFKLVIIGDGPEKANFMTNLGTILPKSRISYYGKLDEKKLKSKWKVITVLVSTAPVESYGRVIREALAAGVPVWATNSSGVQELRSKDVRKVVKILDLTKNGRELSMELDSLIDTKVPQNFRKNLISENSNYPKQLAASWVDLIKRSI